MVNCAILGFASKTMRYQLFKNGLGDDVGPLLHPAAVSVSLPEQALDERPKDGGEKMTAKPAVKMQGRWMCLLDGVVLGPD